MSVSLATLYQLGYVDYSSLVSGYTDYSSLLTLATRINKDSRGHPNKQHDELLKIKQNDGEPLDNYTTRFIELTLKILPHYNGWPIGCFQDIFAAGVDSDLIYDEISKRNFATLDNVFDKAREVDLRISGKTPETCPTGSCNNCGKFNHKKRQCILNY